MGSLTLHVGTPKTGTTYVQGVLAKNRSVLAEQGWVYPGQRVNQQHAMYGLCGHEVRHVRNPDRYRGLANALLEQVHRADSSDVIVSAEVLSWLSSPAIDALLERLGTPRKVLVTIRPLDRLLPSGWQQLLKTGNEEKLDEFIERLDRARPDLSGPWRPYAYGAVVQRWAQFCPVEAIVVPSTSSNAEDLWTLFARAAGLPQLSDTDVPASDANVSLTAAAASLLMQFNSHLRNEGVQPSHAQTLRNLYLKHAVFAIADKDHSPRTELPSPSLEKIRTWNSEELEKVGEHASHIHGVLGDAAVADNHATADAPATTSDDWHDRVGSVGARQLCALTAKLHDSIRATPAGAAGRVGGTEGDIAATDENDNQEVL